MRISSTNMSENNIKVIIICFLFIAYPFGMTTLFDLIIIKFHFLLRHSSNISITPKWCHLHAVREMHKKFTHTALIKSIIKLFSKEINIFSGMITRGSTVGSIGLIYVDIKWNYSRKFVICLNIILVSAPRAICADILFRTFIIHSSPQATIRIFGLFVF